MLLLQLQKFSEAPNFDIANLATFVGYTLYSVCLGVVKMAFFDTFMIKRMINEEIIILLLQQ